MRIIFAANPLNQQISRRDVAAIIFVLLALLAVGAGASAAHAAPAHVQAEVPNARLAGKGDFRWFGLKIYTAEFWVGDGGYRAAAPATARFALDLRYARTLHGSKIAQSSHDEIKKLGIGTPEQHQSWLAQMIRLFPDVKDGTHITGVYLPDLGVRFYLDGKLLGELQDTEFGRAFFAIWLDANTSAPALRKALLQNSVPP
jgi:hypothetical protein